MTKTIASVSEGNNGDHKEKAEGKRVMKVKDLIHELSYFPPDDEVSVFGYVDGEEYEFEIDDVEGDVIPMIIMTGGKI